MAIQWTEDLSVGNTEIDNQHKELFARVNQFLDAMNQRRGKEEVGNVLKFLESYVVEHFGMEERYMIRLNYPEVSSHKEQHKIFMDTFREIIKKYNEKGATVDVVIFTQSRLGEWLRGHIPVIDKKLASFLKAKNK
ncbi:MAG: hemerythrin family protein [Deltaproteobacteria bacterium]|nr:hemerythrin family protein [Deltaproteobacteria bacterium]